MKSKSATAENLQAPVLHNYGGAKKFIADMNDDELEAARVSIMRRVREKAFSKGLPIYYHINETSIAEFPDGSIVPVIRK